MAHTLRATSSPRRPVCAADDASGSKPEKGRRRRASPRLAQTWARPRTGRPFDTDSFTAAGWLAGPLDFYARAHTHSHTNHHRCAGSHTRTFNICAHFPDPRAVGLCWRRRDCAGVWTYIQVYTYVGVVEKRKRKEWMRTTLPLRNGEERCVSSHAPVECRAERPRSFHGLPWACSGVRGSRDLRPLLS